MTARMARALLLVTATASVAIAQRDTLWTRRVSGTGNGDDQVWMLCTDGSGNVLAAGVNMPDDSTSRVAVSKFSPSGELVWTRLLSGRDQVTPAGIAVNALGEVAVTARARQRAAWGFYDILTVKYSAAGDSLWAGWFDGSGENDEPSGVRVADDGSVYVAGYTEGDDYEDMLLLKYSASGQLLWSRQYDFQRYEDYALDLLLDPQGYVYTVGSVLNWNAGGDHDMAVLKYTTGGTRVWARTLRGPADNDDSLVLVTLAPSGNVVVAGCTHRTGTRGGHVVAQLSPSGDSLWAATWEGSGAYNGAVGLGVDAANNVVVAANYQRDSGLVVKYSPTGQELWRRQTNEWDSLVGLVVDAAGNVYTGGNMELNRRRESAVLKLSPAGESLWVRPWTPPADWPRHARALTAVPGGVVLGGGCASAAWPLYRDSNAVVVRYDSGGSVDGFALQGGPGSNVDWARDICFDTAGCVLTAGALDMTGEGRDLAVTKHYPNGDLAWVRTWGNEVCGDDWAAEVATDRWENVYVAGTSDDWQTGRDFVTLKYDPAGQLQWARRYDGPGHGTDSVVGLAIAENGDVVVTGHSFGGTATGLDYATVRYAADGTELWVRRLNGSADSNDFASGVVVDGRGAVYVTGATWELNQRWPATTAKYDVNGDLLWSKSHPAPDSVMLAVAFPSGLAIGSTGDLFVAGGGGSPHFRARLTSDGDSVWVRAYDAGRRANSSAVRVDEQDRLWVAGDVPDSAVLAVYSSDGELRRLRTWYGLTITDVSVAPEGLVYAVGCRFWSVCATYCLDSLGNIRWVDTLRFRLGWQVAMASEADRNGRLAVAADDRDYGRGQWLILLYEPAIGITEGALQEPLLDIQVRPNPFQSCVRMAVGERGSLVTSVAIYDEVGRCVRALGIPSGRSREVVWDGNDAAGRPAPAGVYFALVKALRVGQEEVVRPQQLKLLKQR